MTWRPRGGVEVQVYYFLNLGASLGSVVNATLRPLEPGERDTVLIGQEVARAPGPIWTGVEYHDSTGIRSPDRPARSE